MSEQKKKRVKKPRQEWKPNWVLRVLYRAWLFAFTAAKVAIGAAATVLLIGVVCGFVFVGVLGDFLQDDVLPNAVMDMEGYDYDQTSYLYHVDSKGQIQEYQKVFAETSSQWADYEDFPKHLPNAAIAIEDKRFNEHQGVDWITTVKATAKMFFGDSSVGGSSITQQLIKNILLQEDDSADDVTVQRKVMEIFRAIQFEKRYDKEVIMEMYLNVIYLGQGCQGVRSAAATYFGKELEMLNLAECASLISITNNPSLFDPYSSNTFEYEGELMNGMQRNRHRQLLVLGEMLAQEMITQEEYDEAVAYEIKLKNGISDEDRLTTCPNEACGYVDIVRNFTVEDGIYYCPRCATVTPVGTSASQDIYSWFTDVVLEDVAMAMAEQSGMAWNANTKKLLMQQIQRGGYHIYTTLDLEVQNQVDKIYTNLEEIPAVRGGQQLQSAIVLIDNRTGDIVAMAGGVGKKEGFDDWNRATDAERQSGSSIKPLAVYGPAFELGKVTPATVISDLPHHYDDEGTWREAAYPLNDTRKYEYKRTVYMGVVKSVNAISANTLELVGIDESYDFAKNKFGLSTLVDSYIDANGTEHSDIDMGPLALGAQTWGVTVRDITNAFAVLANQGVYREARTYTKVYDSDGNLILDNTQDTWDVLGKKAVDYTNYCLSEATRYGTGTIAKVYGIDTAGKTGTTSDNMDRWFCGFTNYYTACVWSGFDTPADIKASTNPSAVLFNKVMEPLHEDKKNVSLYDKSKMKEVTICLESGKLATEACEKDCRIGVKTDGTTDVLASRVEKVKVYKEDMPKEKCDKHVEVDFCTTGMGVATEYCQHFAGVDPTVKIEKKSLVKLTVEETKALQKAAKYKLWPQYTVDYYVYQVDKKGKDVEFKGFKGDLQQTEKTPYMVCPLHTKLTWEEYLKQHPEVPGQPTDPSNPSDPSQPNNPLFPNIPITAD